MEINKAEDIAAAMSELNLVIDLQDGGEVIVRDEHLMCGGTLTIKRGNVTADFSSNSYRKVQVDCDEFSHVRVVNAVRLYVARGNVEKVLGTTEVVVRGGAVNVVGDGTEVLDITSGTAVVTGRLRELVAGADAHVRAGTIEYLETRSNAWVYAKSVQEARLVGNSFAYLCSVANGRINDHATAKVLYYGSLMLTDWAGAHVCGRTYVVACDSSAVIATEDCVVRRMCRNAWVRCFDDALTINDTGAEPVGVVGHKGGDATRELSKHAYKGTPDTGYSGKNYDKITKWEVGSIVAADDWEPTPECGHGLHVSRLPGDTLEFLEFRDLRRRPKLFEVQVPDGDDRITIAQNKDKVPSAYVVREVDVVGRPLHY